MEVSSPAFRLDPAQILWVLPYSVLCYAGDLTQGFLHSRRVLYQLSHIPSPCSGFRCSFSGLVFPALWVLSYFLLLTPGVVLYLWRRTVKKFWTFKFLGWFSLCFSSTQYWSLHYEWKQESARTQPNVEAYCKYLRGKYFSISDGKDTVSLTCKGFASKPRSQLFFLLLRQGRHKGSSVPSGIHVTTLSRYSWCLANHTENFTQE